MSSKLKFTICSALTFLLSISFYIFAEFFTKKTFSQAEGYAIELVNAMRYVLAATIFLASSMLFHLRNLTDESNQKSVLFGTSLGFAVVCITLLTLNTTGAINAIPPIITTGLLLIPCCFSQSKLKAE